MVKARVDKNKEMVLVFSVMIPKSVRELHALLAHPLETGCTHYVE